MLNVAMWGRALKVIPRIDKEQWRGLDIVSRWLVATRSAVLVITFISAAIAGLLALRDEGHLALGWWLLLIVGLVLAHATNNLVNDMTDHFKGVDKDNYFRAQYGPQPLEHGLLTSRQMLAYAVVTGLAALAVGGAIVWMRGGLTWWLLAAGLFFVLFYTWPLKYIGLGEPAVLVVWGPLMIGGGYYVLTGVWSWEVVLAGLPYAIGATVVLFGKHIDKMEADREKGIHTLPVILGDRVARASAVALMAAQYLLVIGLVVSGYFTPVMLIVLFALNAFVSVWKLFAKPRPHERPADYPADAWPLWFVAHAFVHNRRFGFLFLVGLVAEVVIRFAAPGWHWTGLV